MIRTGTFEFYERYLRRSIYGFKKISSSSATSSFSGIEDLDHFAAGKGIGKKCPPPRFG